MKKERTNVWSNMRHYYDDWSSEGCNAFKEEVKNLYERLTESERVEAKKLVVDCIANFDNVWELLNLVHTTGHIKGAVLYYVDRLIELLKYRCQEKGFYDGLMMGFNQEPCAT